MSGINRVGFCPPVQEVFANKKVAIATAITLIAVTTLGLLVLCGGGDANLKALTDSITILGGGLLVGGGATAIILLAGNYGFVVWRRGKILPNTSGEALESQSSNGTLLPTGLEITSKPKDPELGRKDTTGQPNPKFEGTYVQNLGSTDSKADVETQDF